jgi:hypothetical protein
VVQLSPWRERWTAVRHSTAVCRAGGCGGGAGTGSLGQGGWARSPTRAEIKAGKEKSIGISFS